MKGHVDNPKILLEPTLQSCNLLLQLTALTASCCNLGTQFADLCECFDGGAPAFLGQRAK